MVEFEVINVRPLWSYFKKSGKKIKGFEMAVISCMFLTKKEADVGDIVMLNDDKLYMVTERKDDDLTIKYVNTKSNDFKTDGSELIGAGCVNGKWK